MWLQCVEDECVRRCVRDALILIYPQADPDSTSEVRTMVEDREVGTDRRRTKNMQEEGNERMGAWSKKMSDSDMEHQ